MEALRRSARCWPVAVAVALALASGCGEVAPATPDADDPVDPLAPDAMAADAAPDAALTLDRPERWVAQHGSATLTFAIERTVARGALTVRVAGLPAGVTAPDVEVAADRSDGTLTLSASAASTLGAPSDVTVELVAGDRVLDTAPLQIMISGAPGSVDTTFGTGGRRVVALPDPVIAAATGNAAARAIAQYPASAGVHAGKLVVAADLLTSGPASTAKRIALARFNVDGTVDTGFGGGTGYVLLDPGAAGSLLPVAVAIDSQGRVVVAAMFYNPASYCMNLVMRVTAAGVVDPTFTTYASDPPGGYCGRTQSLAVIGGDKLLLVGVWNNPGGSQLPMLLQLASDGTPDTTAFPGGAYTVRLGNPGAGKPVMSTPDLLVDSGGRYVMPGFRCEGGWNVAGLSACESVVARATAAGAWDPSFGAGAGYVALTFGTTPTPNLAVQSFHAVALDGDDDVVAVGWTESAASGVLARFDGTTGALDAGFGVSGRITPVLVAGATSQSLDDVVIDAEGRIVAVGEATSGGPLLLTTRYSAAGVLDTGYGAGGVQTVLGAADVRPRAVLQADGRLVAAGAYPRPGGGHDLVLWRFWP